VVHAVGHLLTKHVIVKSWLHVSECLSLTLNLMFVVVHVEVRPCLWTVATNWPMSIPQVIYVYGEPWWNDTDRGKLKNLDKNMSQYHFVHQNSHMHWPRPLQWGQQLTAGPMAQLNLMFSLLAHMITGNKIVYWVIYNYQVVHQGFMCNKVSDEEIRIRPVGKGVVRCFESCFCSVPTMWWPNMITIIQTTFTKIDTFPKNFSLIF
jgi:hypothetical protein